MTAYVETIQQKCPKAKLIWAAITPVTVRANRRNSIP